jgi:hypothetical protein
MAAQSPIPSYVQRRRSLSLAATHPLSPLVRVYLPLCVILVINDNPHGLIFSLILYEGIAHRNCLKSMCWIHALDAMERNIYVKYWHQDH